MGTYPAGINLLKVNTSRIRGSKSLVQQWELKRGHQSHFGSSPAHILIFSWAMILGMFCMSFGPGFFM